jgi:hypothetical protein
MIAARLHDSMTKVEFAFRAASVADVDDLLVLWEEAAENRDRPLDTAEAVIALLSRDPEALILAEHDGVLSTAWA